jgi:hypothetical protein
MGTFSSIQHANQQRSMESWAQFDPADVLLSSISKSYKTYAVKKFVHDLTESKVWRGKQLPREYPAERKPKPKRQDSASPRKRRAPSSSSSPPSKKAKSSATLPVRKRPSPATSPLRPKKTWTKEQREEATAKKAQEVEVAASVGLRRSPRARVPTEKVLE